MQSVSPKRTLLYVNYFNFYVKLDTLVLVVEIGSCRPHRRHKSDSVTHLYRGGCRIESDAGHEKVVGVALVGRLVVPMAAGCVVVHVGVIWWIGNKRRTDGLIRITNNDNR